jgi:hypothetical protein
MSSTPGNRRRRSCVEERPLHLSELPSLYFPRSNPYFQSPIHNCEAATPHSHQRRGQPSPRYTCINPPPTCKGSRECSFHPYCSKGPSLGPKLGLGRHMQHQCCDASRALNVDSFGRFYRMYSSHYWYCYAQTGRSWRLQSTRPTLL